MKPSPLTTTGHLVRHVSTDTQIWITLLNNFHSVHTPSIALCVGNEKSCMCDFFFSLETSETLRWGTVRTLLSSRFRCLSWRPVVHFAKWTDGATFQLSSCSVHHHLLFFFFIFVVWYNFVFGFWKRKQAGNFWDILEGVSYVPKWMIFDGCEFERPPWSWRRFMCKPKAVVPETSMIVFGEKLRSQH